VNAACVRPKYQSPQRYRIAPSHAALALSAQVVEGAVALVLPQPPLVPRTRNVYPGVFGGQMFPSSAAAAIIGMRTVRSGPLWEWSQPNECWNETTCFDWSFYDDIFSSSAAGIEVRISVECQRVIPRALWCDCWPPRAPLARCR
jgi:hypothetical protein